MKIQVAKHTGFCMGVRRGVLRIVKEINRTNEEILVYGPLIHNPQTITILDSRGAKTVDTLDAIDGKAVAIRTHGVPRESLSEIKRRARRSINLTCSKVARVQSIVRQLSRKGYCVLIIGDPEHAEVAGIRSHACGEVAVISCMEDIDRIPVAARYGIVAQTTLNTEFFADAVALIRERNPDCLVHHTICDSTNNRQQDVMSAIAGGIDTLVVVGGKNSANTRRLAEIGEEQGIKTVYAETESEINERDFADSQSVLLTAGASTPSWIVNNVLERLYAINYRRSWPLNALKSLLEAVIRSHLLVSLCTLFIPLLLIGLEQSLQHPAIPLIGSLYVFSMYTVNNYLGLDYLRTVNPFKYRLYLRYRIPLIAASIAAGILSMMLVFRFDFPVSVFYTAMMVIGGLYSLPAVDRLVHRLPYTLIRRLYRMKSLTASVGWVAVAAILPLCAGLVLDWPRFFAGAIFACGMVFIRNILFDVIAYQSDLIVGRETFPTVFGLAKTGVLVFALAGASILAMTFLAWHEGQPRFLLFTLNSLYYLALYRKTIALHHFYSLHYEVLIESNFFLFVLLCATFGRG